jgi:hypothetical protein
MPDRRYRWVIVAAGSVLGCVAIGALFSLPVFLGPMSAATGWSRTGISLASVNRALLEFQLVVGLLVGHGRGLR